jgi:hypothetical protein
MLVSLYYNFLEIIQTFSQEISIQRGEANDAPIVQADRPIIQANRPIVLDADPQPNVPRARRREWQVRTQRSIMKTD